MDSEIQLKEVERQVAHLYKQIESLSEVGRALKEKIKEEKERVKLGYVYSYKNKKTRYLVVRSEDKNKPLSFICLNPTYGDSFMIDTFCDCEKYGYPFGNITNSMVCLGKFEDVYREVGQYEY
jgi:hypothetical protein